MNTEEIKLEEKTFNCLLDLYSEKSIAETGRAKGIFLYDNRMWINIGEVNNIIYTQEVFHLFMFERLFSKVKSLDYDKHTRKGTRETGYFGMKIMYENNFYVFGNQKISFIKKYIPKQIELF